MADGAVPKELIYLSWGGTGRAAALRAALSAASEADAGLVYLGVLDNGTFSDIDDTTLALARSELAWLLDAQVELTRSQLGAEAPAVRVLVRAGDVADEVDELVAALGDTEVLVGAPVPVAGHDTVADLIETLNARVPVPVRLVDEPAIR